MTATLLRLAQAGLQVGLPTGNPQTIHLTKPHAGQALNVALDGQVTLDFSAIAEEKLTLVRVGDNLVVLFDNGSTVSIGPAFDAAGDLRDGLSFALAAGHDVSATEFTALFPITADQSVLPAGFGGAPASGAHFVDVPPVDTLTQGAPLPLLGAQSVDAATTAGRADDTALVNHAANHPPIAVADNAAAVEAGVHPGNTPFSGVPLASGNVLANDGDPDATDSVRVVGVTAGTAASAGDHIGATLNGTFGNLVLNADGNWTYVLDNNAAATQALAQGAHGSDVFTYTISDSAGATATATLTLDILGTNDTPAITTAPPAVTVHEQDGTAQSTIVHVVTDHLLFADVDAPDSHTAGATLASAQWSSGALPAHALDDVSFTAQVGGAGTVDWTFSAPDADLDFLAAGDALTLAYDVTVSDANLASATETVTITIIGSNDAPILTASNPTLPTLASNASPSLPGTTVADLVGAHVGDPDANALHGIAVTGAASQHGSWLYSTDGGATWSAFGNYSTTWALLLAATDLVKFAPDDSGGGTERFDFVAWDQTAGTHGDTSDTTLRGGSSAFSTVSDTVSVDVAFINSAPVLTLAEPTLAAITEDQTDPAGTTIATLLGSHVVDQNSGAVQGIAITGASESHGDWQFSTDGGTTWTDFATYSTGAALLLAATDLVRFAPDAAQGSTDTFSFVAWDQTAGTHGDTADVTTRGGTTAFSTASDTASIAVSDVNDAPVLHAPTEVTIAANTAFAFTGADALSLTDVDAGTGTMEIDIRVQHGSLTIVVPHFGAETFNVEARVDGSLPGLDTLLQSAVFTPDAGFTGDATIAITINDNGNTGIGGPLGDSANITLHVESINHPATITALPITETTLADGFESGLGTPWGITGFAGADHQTVESGTTSAQIIGGDGADDVAAASESQLEAALHLPAGALAENGGHPATDGSAIAATLTIDAGTYTLAFDWQYQANDSLPFADDFAFAAIDGNVYKLADVASVGGDNSGWQHATITLDLAGAVTFGFGAMNTDDTIADGVLWVDNVSLTTSSTSDHGAVTEDIQSTTNGVLVVTDPDPGEAALQAVTNGTAAHGHYTVAADGTWTYTLDNSDPDVDALAPGESLTDGFTVTSLDGSATHAVTITIAGTDDAPTSASTTKTGAETAPVAFAVADFGFHDVDDGDALAGIKIDTLPTIGNLLLNGIAVTASEVIAAADIAQLSFAPANRAADYSASFTFQVEDQHGAFDATPRTMTLQIAATDALPDGKDLSLSVDESSILGGFALNDYGFTDPDQGDTLAGLAIASLPSAADGALMLIDRTTGQMSPLAPGTIIAKADLDLLRFVPVDKTASYDAHFTIQVEDSVGGLDPTPQTVTVHVTGRDDNPQFFAISRSVGEDAAGLSVNLLTEASAHDADSPTLSVTGVPAQITTAGGRTLVEGTDYTVTGADFELTTQGLAQFQILPANHSDSFVLPYAISDGIVAPGNTLTVTVNGADEVGPAPPPPQILSEITGLYASVEAGHFIRSTPDPSVAPIAPLPTNISFTIPTAVASGTGLLWSMNVIYSSLQGTVSFNSSTDTISYDALHDSHSGLAILKLTATDPFGQSVDTYTTVTALDHGLASDDVFMSSTASISGGAGFIGGDGGDDPSFLSSSQVEANIAIGNGGDDYLVSDPSQTEAGDDAIYGGTGNDFVVGGAGNDFLSGGDGADRLIGGPGNDVVLGGAGDDIIYIAGTDAAGDLLIDGGSGQDQLVIGSITNLFTVNYVASAELSSFGPQNSIELISSVGGSHATLQGTSGDNAFDFSATQLINVDVDMGDGNDSVVTSMNTNGTSYAGGSGTDDITLLFSASQLETVLTDAGMRAAMQSYLDGTPGDGNLTLALGVTSWNGIVSGFETAELALSAGGSSYVVDSTIGSTLPAFMAGATGDDGNNLLVGSSGDDTGTTALLGNGGNDILVGGNGNDSLDGGSGDDLLLGGNGNDRLIGGPGNDILSGGAGADTFRINGPTEGLDHILDFNASQGDVIELLASAFGVAAGGDASAVFGSDTTANAGSATERFHFDTANHTLYYDADGNGAAATPIAIARLENGATLIGSDIHPVAA